MEGLFQLFQVFGCNSVIACNDIVYHSGTIEGWAITIGEFKSSFMASP